MELKKEVNVEKLISRFLVMATRGALLTGKHITQEDLFVQIAGVIASEAMVFSSNKDLKGEIKYDSK